jgi:hypothetical protein
MKRQTSLAYFGTIALLATGCVDRAYAQADAPDGLDLQATPRPTLVNVPAQSDVIAKWQLPASNPWAAYEKLTLLSVIGGTSEIVALPSTDGLDEVKLAELAATQVVHDGLPADAMWMVDLRGAASVAFGTTLSKYAREPVSIIPTFNNWPFEDELVPAEETLSAMIARAPHLTTVDETSSRPVFLLDSWRLAYKDETIDDEVVDNRYMLSPADFPNVAKLREYGITHVVYVVSDVNEALYEEDDLNSLFLSYQAAGITIHIVDLAELAQVRDEEHDPELYFEIQLHHYIVVPRATVVNNPLFYQRAHGGFGGTHGAPTIWSPAYLGSGGGHGGYGGGGHYGGHGGG